MKRVTMMFLLLALVLTVEPVRAQKDSADSQLRTVLGTVLDKNEKPLPSAVVYLENVRTLTVKTYISGANGEYHFSGLDPNVDYEIHAETSEQTSGNHTVSTFDSRKEIVVPLKVDKEKKKNEK